MLNFETVREFLDWLAYGKLLVDIVAAVFSAQGVRAVLTTYNVPPVWTSPIEWLVGLVVLILMLKYGNRFLPAAKSKPQGSSSSLQTARTNALTRSSSFAPGKFDSKDFFRISYYSVLQDVASNSFREEAERIRPEDKESFYLDVLGIGTVAYGYDLIWWPMFRSQLLALLSLNKSGGLSPRSMFLDFYNEAARTYPSEYGNFPFEQWVGYLERNTLVNIHASNMVEITIKGKDFLKYLLHNGKSEESKRL